MDVPENDHLIRCSIDKKLILTRDQEFFGIDNLCGTSTLSINRRMVWSLGPFELRLKETQVSRSGTKNFLFGRKTSDGLLDINQA